MNWQRQRVWMLISVGLVFSLGVILIAAIAVAQNRAARRSPPTGVVVPLKHEGRDRVYRIHVPDKLAKAKQPVPLVVCLHGGGGTADQISGIGLSAKADEYGFIAVYPNAIDKHWNDGRDSQRFADHDQSINDVSFIMAVIKEVGEKHKIDAKRVFAMGVSNGGFMSQRLAVEQAETFSAIGVVVASIGEPLQKRFSPKLPVSVLMMNGTDDPLVPYAGGEVTVDLFPKLNRLRNQPNASRGYCVPTDETVAMWVKRNQLPNKPIVKNLPDKDKSDGSHVELSLWKDGEQGTAVALYKVVGGGHMLPGGNQKLPERLVGKTNRDIDGLDTIWRFFDKHARRQTFEQAEGKTKPLQAPILVRPTKGQNGKNRTVSPTE